MNEKTKLPAKQPFNFERVIESHGWVQLAPFKLAQKDGLVTYTARLSSGDVVDIKLSDAGDGVFVETEPQMAVRDANVHAMVRWMFSLEQGFDEFYELAVDHPKLSHVVEQGKGRLLRGSSLFEDVVKTILTTNTSWAGTIRMVAALVEHFGEPMPDDVRQRAFPSAEALAVLSLEELSGSAGLGYRTPYVLELSRDVASGLRALESLRFSDESTEEIRRELLSIKGVGEYAAASILMLLGRYDFIPIDSWAFKLVSHEWHQGAPIGREEVEEAFASWGPWKGLAYWFWDWEYLKDS